MQYEVPGGPYDYAFAAWERCSSANPVAAMRNVRARCAPAVELCKIVWRRKLDNEWMYRSEEIVDRHVSRLTSTNRGLTCGPGPFSMANADTITDVLKDAGFERVSAA